jgi:hypothetical protein
MGSKPHLMNYHYTKDIVVSGFIDSSNKNSSTCFCLMSDLVPEPDNIFSPSLRIFLLALKSLS